MAFRRPLYYSSGQLLEMTDLQIADLVQMAAKAYLVYPSVYLSIVGSGGNLGTLTDTRWQAGAYSTSTTAFPTSATTADISLVTVNYSRVNQNIYGAPALTDTNNTRYPLYYSNNQIQAMTFTDLVDTILGPAIDYIYSNIAPYYVTTASSLSGYTQLGYIHYDTQADVAAYTAAGIPETLDQPYTFNIYYLHQYNASYYDSIAAFPVKYTSSVVETYSLLSIRALLQDGMRWVAENASPYRLRYQWGSTGSVMGGYVTDTRLNGSGNYQTYYVNTDDYRAQEFPNGSSAIVNQWLLRMTKS